MKGPHTRWVMNPYVFDNTYFKELLLKDQSKYYKTEADMKLLQNVQLKNWVSAYADDQDLFFRNYAKAHVKVSELGWEGKLLSEFENHRIVDGGYQEESRLKKWINAARVVYGAHVTGQTEQEFIEAEEDERATAQIEEKWIMNEIQTLYQCLKTSQIKHSQTISLNSGAAHYINKLESLFVFDVWVFLFNL